MHAIRTQEFILFAEDRLAVRRVGLQPNGDSPACWGPEVSDFGHIASGSEQDSYPPTDYLERAAVQTAVRAAWNDRCLFLRIHCAEPRLQQACTFHSPSIHFLGSFPFEYDFRAREDVEVHLDVPWLAGEVISLSIGIDGRLAQRRNKPPLQRENGIPEWGYSRGFGIRWHAEITYQPEAWLVVVTIPFAELGIEPVEGMNMGINFSRNEFVIPEFSVWRGHSYWAVIPEKMGRLTLAGAEIDASAAPTVTMTQSLPGHTLRCRRGQLARVAVNEEYLARPDAPFTLKQFTANTIAVETTSQSRSREIFVTSDTQLVTVGVPEVAKEELLAKIENLRSVSELRYWGDGIYGSPGRSTAPPCLQLGITQPDPSGTAVRFRDTAFCALAFLHLHDAQPNPRYAARARQCLDWLLTQQRADGAIPIWSNPDPSTCEIWPVELHNSDCFFENGNVGLALLAGYRILHDSKYLHSAIRIAEFNLTEPPSHNTNYNAFCLFFEPELSHLTGDQRFIWDAIHKYHTGVRVGQMLSGEWPAHNIHTCYLGIIGFGLARLAQFLAEDSPVRTEVKARLIRLLNCFVRRLDGAVGITHPHPSGSTNGAAQALLAAVAAAEVFDLDVTGLTNHLVRWMLNRAYAGSTADQSWDMFALARFIHWRFPHNRGIQGT